MQTVILKRTYVVPIYTVLLKLAEQGLISKLY